MTITLSDIEMQWRAGIGIADSIEANIAAVSKPAEPLPLELYGADNVRITVGDVTEITLSDGSKVSVDKLTPDSWATVVCEGFTYITPPLGQSSNSLDDPGRFAGNTASDGASFDNSDYTRLNVGDKYGDLTLSSAKTIFRNFGTSPRERLSECIAEFDGSVTLDAYIIRGINNNTVSPGAMICVPKSGDTSLPVMFPLYKDGKFTSKAYNGEYVLWEYLTGLFEYKNEYPAIYLQNVNDYNLATLFEEGMDIAEVTVTLSDIYMDCYLGENISRIIFWRILTRYARQSCRPMTRCRSSCTVPITRRYPLRTRTIFSTSI